MYILLARKMILYGIHALATGYLGSIYIFFVTFSVVNRNCDIMARLARIVVLKDDRAKAEDQLAVFEPPLNSRYNSVNTF
jgi:hypothetical protein